MELLIVSRETYQDKAFGLGKAIGAIAEGLKQKGHSVTYITIADWGKNENTLFKRLIRIGGFISRFLGFADYVIPPLAERFLQGMRAAKMVQNERYSHVWFQDPWIVMGFLYRQMFTINAHKIVWGVSEHGLGSFTQAVLLDGLALTEQWTKLLLRIEKYILKKSAFVWGPSTSTITLLTRDMGYARAPSHWRSIGYGKPVLNLMDKDAARALLGWDDATLYVIAIGRVAPVKRFDIVIQACAVAQTKVENLQLVIIGGEIDQNLIDLARTSGLTHIPISIFTPSIDTYLAAADIYVSACEFESFGLANMEAICAELPCVIAAGGGAIEVVSSGGWLCHPDPLSMGEAIKAIATDSTIKAFWKNAAKKRSSEFKEWREVVEEYEKCLSSYSKN